MSYISITIFIQLQIHIVDKNFSTFFQSFMLSNLISHYRLITNDNSTLLYILCSRFLKKTFLQTCELSVDSLIAFVMKLLPVIGLSSGLSWLGVPP